MNVVNGLTLLASLLLGVLLALLFDAYTLGRRVRAAVLLNRRLQHKMRQLAGRLVSTQREAQAAHARARELHGELSQTQKHLEQAAAENQSLQQRLETATAEIAKLQGNLGRLNHYLEQLESKGESLRQQLEAAADEKQGLAGNLARLENELDELRLEHQRACQQVSVTEVEMKHLRQELAEAQQWADRAHQLQLDNQALDHKAQAAEGRAEELKAQVKGLLRQLGETQSLHKQLVAAEDKVRTAEAQLRTLQAKLSTVKQILDYTGKNQLRLIRGIGPTYARRLNEAGIHSLNDLARQSPERLREIVELKKWQAADLEEWIDEAQALSVRLDGEGAQPATADSPPATDPSQNAQ